jgi:hypothetical protein
MKHHNATHPGGRLRWHIAAIIAALALAAALALSGATAPKASADLFDLCPSGQTGVVTADTSCAFADNVRIAYYTQPGSTVVAYSPVTDTFYVMTCLSTWTTWWPEAKRCFGSNAFGANLVVYVN